MPRRWPERPSVRVWFATAWAMILCLIWFGTSEPAPDVLVNCNEVMSKDRCACNERVLRALTHNRPVVVDPTQGGSAGETNAAIAIQQERQHRLRTFYAPDCEVASSPKRLPVSAQPTGSWQYRDTIEHHLKPLGTRTIDVIDDDSIDVDSEEGVGGNIPSDILLPGRWEGWATPFGGTPSPVSFHVIRVDGHGRFVKACSDQGMVLARVKDGYLEFPRSDPFGLAYSIRLWNSRAPNSRDLEGVTLLEVRPGKVVIAGLVWLSRAVRFDWSSPPSSYFCQDRDLEEQRKVFSERQEKKREENETALLMQLKEQVQQLKRELEAVRVELEAARSGPFVGDLKHRGGSVHAK